jgi:hypothetical protein
MSVARESGIVDSICAYMARRGDSYGTKIHGDEFSEVGTPDLIYCVGGRYVAIEVKQPGERPKKIQSYRLQQIREAGGIAFWATSAEEVELLLAHYGVPPAHGQSVRMPTGADSDLAAARL